MVAFTALMERLFHPFSSHEKVSLGIAIPRVRVDVGSKEHQEMVPDIHQSCNCMKYELVHKLDLMDFKDPFISIVIGLDINCTWSKKYRSNNVYQSRFQT